jgi:hypothetical protein
MSFVCRILHQDVDPPSQHFELESEIRRRRLSPQENLVFIVHPPPVKMVSLCLIAICYLHANPGERLMRSEQEMSDLILSTARQDVRIRAVILNGSRLNPHVPRDLFQDSDILYIVTDVMSFTRDPGWIARFGEPMVMQTPDDMGVEPPGADDSYAYLMQFVDGNRIDLTLYPLARLDELPRDSLSLLLLDKDGVIPPSPRPMRATICPSRPRRSSTLIAVMSSGGSAPTSPRVFGGGRSSTPGLCSIRSCASSWR